MMPFKRPEAPGWLRTGERDWGKRLYRRRKANANAKFNWPQRQKEKINHLLAAILVEASSNHCAYCDCYPLGTASRQTIDHFKPKTTAPLLVCFWENLFLACDVCQQVKGERYSRKMLKPDRPNYTFERYFISNFKTGRIEASPNAPSEERDMAWETIEWLGLNMPGRPQSRLVELEKFSGNGDLPIECYSYRFFLEFD